MFNMDQHVRPSLDAAQYDEIRGDFLRLYEYGLKKLLCF